MFKEYLHCFVVLKGEDLVKYTYYYLNLVFWAPNQRIRILCDGSMCHWRLRFAITGI